MNVWQALIIGLLVGWVIEWVIDWIYWRSRRAESSADLTVAVAERDRLRADLDVARRDAAEVGTLRTSLADCRANGQRLEAELKTANGLAPSLRAELERVKGDLVTAQALAGERMATIDRLEAELRTAQAAPERHAMLGNAPTLGAPAVLGAVAAAGTSEGLHAENERLRDPLVDINGIGPVYEKKLFDVGIYTFAQLADLSPERIREIIKPEEWQKIEAEAWIAEARARATSLNARSAAV